MAKHETSTTYRWPASEAGLVDAVEIVRQKNGRAVAYLHAKESESFKQQRMETRAAIRAKGWGTLSDFREGQHVLRVGGLEDPAELLDLLRDMGGTKGTPSIAINRAAQVVEPKTGFIGFIRNHSLTISGIMATAGNALSIASGFARGKEIGQIGQGASFAIADLPLAIAGERDDGRQLSNLLRHLKKHYVKQGVDIPASASIHVETSDQGKSLGELTRDYLHRYANQIKCAMEVVAAFFTFYAGKKQNNREKMIAASIFGPGFLASLVIPERKIDEEKYAQAGILGKLWMRLQSNPLSVGGLLGYSNTFFTYKGAFREQAEEMAKKAAGNAFTNHYKWDFAIPSVMIGANGTYAISKKTVGGDIRNEAMEQDIYSIASQILNKQQPNKREAAFESTVNFLAERPEVRGNKDEVRQMLRETMVKQSQNPWFEPLALTLSPAQLEQMTHPHPAAHTPKPHLTASEVTHVAKGVEAANEAQILQTANAR